MRLTVLAASLLLASSAFAADKVKVGFVSTLSGPGAGLGVDIRDGFNLAVKHLNGKLGNLPAEVIIADDQQKPDVAKAETEKFLKKDKVDFMTGIVFSNIMLAVGPQVFENKTFYISANAGPSQYAGEQCNPFFFNVAWQNDNLHEGAGAWANQTGYKKTFILAPNYPAGKDALTGYKRTYKGELAGEIYTELGQTDYAAEIAQIRASDADSVFLFLPGGMGISFLKQYADSGVGKPVIGPGFSFDQDILGAVGDAALGAVNTSQWSKDIDNPTNKAFVDSFQAEYGRLPSLYASQGFDTANLLISALNKAQPADADAFRAALEAAEFDSTRGAFKFGPNHHPIQTIYAREVVKEGDVLTNKIIGTAMTDRGDAYAEQCKM